MKFLGRAFCMFVLYGGRKGGEFIEDIYYLQGASVFSEIPTLPFPHTLLSWSMSDQDQTLLEASGQAFFHLPSTFSSAEKHRAEERVPLCRIYICTSTTVSPSTWRKVWFGALHNATFSWTHFLFRSSLPSSALSLAWDYCTGKRSIVVFKPARLGLDLLIK